MLAGRMRYCLHSHRYLPPHPALLALFERPARSTGGHGRDACPKRRERGKSGYRFQYISKATSLRKTSNSKIMTQPEFATSRVTILMSSHMPCCTMVDARSAAQTIRFTFCHEHLNAQVNPPGPASSAVWCAFPQESCSVIIPKDSLTSARQVEGASGAHHGARLPSRRLRLGDRIS